MLCPYCNQSHPDNARFCPVTGKTLQPVESQPELCPNCGNPIHAGARFCPFCGHILGAPSETTTVVTAPSRKESTETTIAAAAPGRKEKKRRDWRAVIYIGLAVFGLIAILAGGWLVWSGLRQEDGSSKTVASELTPTRTKRARLTPSITTSGTSGESSSSQDNPPIDTLTATLPPTSKPPTATSTPAASPTQAPSPTSLPSPTPLPTTAVAPVDVRLNDKDNAEMVMVPSGEFWMGANPETAYFWGAEAPQHRVRLDAFWIYRTEVTNAMYQACVKAERCPKPVRINHPISDEYGDERFANYPVVLVSYKMATAYCKWAGGRLPTEAEWEKAARGEDGRMFPWGDSPAQPNLANYGSSGPEAVGSYPAGASPYGVLDMAGNVLEWVFDAFQDDYYRTSPDENPRGPASGDRRVIRGGAYHSLDEALRAAARTSLRSSDTNIDLGFRCAMDTR